MKSFWITVLGIVLALAAVCVAFLIFAAFIGIVSVSVLSGGSTTPFWVVIIVLIIIDILLIAGAKVCLS